MRQVSPERWRIAQKHERLYQENKAALLRDSQEGMVQQSLVRGRELHEFLSPFISISNSTQILEVGSGPHGAVFCLREGQRFAMDPLAILYRREFPGIQLASGARITCARGETLPFLSNCIDLIISDNVLDHTMAPDSILEEIRRVSKPGAILLLAMNVCFWPGRILARMHEATLTAVGQFETLGPHPFCFSEGQIVRMITQKGFKTLYKNAVSHEQEGPGRTSSIKRKLLSSLFRPQYLKIVCRNDK